LHQLENEYNDPNSKWLQKADHMTHFNRSKKKESEKNRYDTKETQSQKEKK